MSEPVVEYREHHAGIALKRGAATIIIPWSEAAKLGAKMLVAGKAKEWTA